MTSDALRELIADGLNAFYRQRMKRLESLKLRDILKKKNPYLFKAVGMNHATELVERLLQAFLSSSDETIFGDMFFEPIAKAVSGGVVSPTEGADVAIETEDRYVAIAVKSGPNPFNSSQAKRQNQEFLALRQRLMKLKKQFDPVLGHCYGRKRSEPTATRIYRIRAGQAFWRELTGDSDFYLKLMDAIESSQSKAHRDEYDTAWANAVNRYAREFMNEFCGSDGAIDWIKLLRFNSAEQPLNATEPR